MLVHNTANTYEPVGVENYSVVICNKDDNKDERNDNKDERMDFGPSNIKGKYYELRALVNDLLDNRTG